MGYKSRANFPMGQTVSQEHWNNIFKGVSDEPKIGCDKRISDSGGDIQNESGRCPQTQGTGENDSGPEWKSSPSSSGDIQANCCEDTDRISHLHSRQEG